MKSNLTKKKLTYVLIVMGLLSYCVSIDRAKAAANLAALPTTGNQYLVEFKSARLPSDLQNRIAALGGRIIDTFPEMKVVLIADLSDEAAAALDSQADVADVTLDEFVTAPRPALRNRPGQFPPNPIPTSASQPELASFYPYQWDKRVIAADRAWQAGFLGSPDVRVAIIDTGIDPAHPDLIGLIDASRSASFCSDEDPIVAQQFPGYPAWTDLYGHGSAVASIVSSNGLLTAGVTSRTTLMGLKALGLVPCRGSGLFRAIYYAADHGADVLNMSIGVPIGIPKSRGQKGFFHYYHLAVQYALVKGVSAVVVAAGNSALDLDHNGNEFTEFCDVPGVMCVSATGPTDSGPLLTGPFVNVDASAFYTNFGASAIDVAAPGGNLTLDSSNNIIGAGWVWSACPSTDREFDGDGNIRPGWCSSHGYLVGGGAGTSFAAPHVAGLAALLVSQLGHGKSAQVRAAIEKSVDDRGKPGVDPYYGHGRINVARALGLP
jgi:subtilisin family serine protease